MQVFVERIEPFGAFVVGCDQRFDGEGADLPGFVDLERVPDPCLRAASATKVLATCNPARLNALLGEVQVTERRSNSSQSEANGV